MVEDQTKFGSVRHSARITKFLLHSGQLMYHGKSPICIKNEIKNAICIKNENEIKKNKKIIS